MDLGVGEKALVRLSRKLSVRMGVTGAGRTTVVTAL
eukprot:CAMPEP_0185208570 /NCGR_PEP_ID=MMETSP1140-20130426/62230_1 /TAXON_ID=298111 /ORGANISM="Pavlova sp., Strain CCMP459" /LENGTH=35 /DNA_ID= /DNA_START= /DNA_END= /DNA_ORIENTATION=